MEIRWLNNRTFAAVVTGHKNVTGLVIEADGLRVVTVPKTATLPPVMYRGKPYPQRKALTHYKRAAKLPGTSRQARRLLSRARQEFQAGGC